MSPWDMMRRFLNKVSELFTSVPQHLVVTSLRSVWQSLLKHFWVWANQGEGGLSHWATSTEQAPLPSVITSVSRKDSVSVAETVDPSERGLVWRVNELSLYQRVLKTYINSLALFPHNYLLSCFLLHPSPHHLCTASSSSPSSPFSLYTVSSAFSLYSRINCPWMIL